MRWGAKRLSIALRSTWGGRPSSADARCADSVTAICGCPRAGGAQAPAAWVRPLLGHTSSQQPGPAALVAGLHSLASSAAPLDALPPPRGGHERWQRQQAAQQRAAAGAWRGLQASPSTWRPPGRAALGVVDKLHDDTAIVLPATGRRNFWEVLEFRPDASVLETWKTPEVLGLHPRDVYVFASEASYGSQRAMIVPRPSAILFKTEVCKAVIYYDKAVLFPARRLQDTIRIAQALKSAIHQKSALPFEFKVLESLLSETVRNYESKCKRLGIVAESVLSEINAHFHGSAGELQRLLPIQRKLNELQNDVKDVLDAIADIVNYDESIKAVCLSENERHRQQARAAAQGTVVAEQRTKAGQEQQRQQEAAATEQRAAEGEGSSSSKMPSPLPPSSPGTAAAAAAAAVAPPALPLSGVAAAVAGLPPPAPGNAAGPGGTAPKKRTSHMRMVTAVLESYENKLLGIHNGLREQLEGMEQTRTVWHMQLDHQRNRVLRINLLISIMSFAVVLCTMPAAYLGMNVSSGLEDVPGIFWPIVQASAVMGASAGGLLYGYYRFGPKRRYKARLRDMRSLRDLLMFHMDDIDDVVDAVKARGRVSRGEFTSIVRDAVKGRPMSQDEIDLVYRVFDTNRDGFLEMSELLRLEDHIDSFSSTHLS